RPRRDHRAELVRAGRSIPRGGPGELDRALEMRFHGEGRDGGPDLPGPGHPVFLPRARREAGVPGALRSRRVPGLALRRVMKRQFLGFVLLIAALHVFGEDLLYRSNDFGMPLQRIAPYQQGASRWILRVRRTGLDEVRLLSDNGKEVRRWELSWNTQRTEKVEKEIAGSLLAARRVYDASGGLLQEEEYTAGALSKKTLFTYANGRLEGTRVRAGSDERQVSQEEYFYATNGGLREVRRTVAAGETSVSSSLTGSSGLTEERSS